METNTTSPFAYADDEDLGLDGSSRQPVLVLDRYIDEDGLEIAHVRDGNGEFHVVKAGLLIEVNV